MSRRLAFCVTAVCIVSLSLNAAVSLRHRIPRFLWDTFSWSRLPDIPLAKDYPEDPPPQLSFSLTVSSSAELPAWRVQARKTFIDRLGVPLPSGPPEVRIVRSESVGRLTRETIVLTADDGLEIPGFLFLPPGPMARPAVAVIPGWSDGIVYRLRVLGQWFDGIRFYAAASSPRRSRRTWAGLR